MNYELRKERNDTSEIQRLQVLCTLTGWFLFYRKNKKAWKVSRQALEV